MKKLFIFATILGVLFSAPLFAQKDSTATTAGKDTSRIPWLNQKYQDAFPVAYGFVLAEVRAQADKPLEHDAWSDEGLQERINQQAAKMMQQMLTPLQEDLAAQSRQVALSNFKTQHPDLTSDDIRMPVAKLLMDRPELKLEDAYFIVKGQVSKQAADTMKQTQRDTLMKTSTGNAVRSATPPKFKDAWSAYQWHKANGGK